MKGISFSVCFIIFSLSPSFSEGQTLAFYADVMINADKAEHRSYAAKEFSKLLAERLNDDNQEISDLEEIPWINTQYAPDSSFLTITWYLNIGEGVYFADGYLKSDNLLWKLGGRRGQSSLRSNQEISFDRWKGGLIYKILPSMKEGAYLLLSYGQTDEFTKYKTLEPLHFGSEGPIVGKSGFFQGQPEIQSAARLAMQYSVDSNAGYTLDEETLKIVFDNLAPVQGRLPGQGPTMVPDGSYKAFELNASGEWVFVEKLYDQWNEGPLQSNRDRSSDKVLFKGKN